MNRLALLLLAAAAALAQTSTVITIIPITNPTTGAPADPGSLVFRDLTGETAKISAPDTLVASYRVRLWDENLTGCVKNTASGTDGQLSIAACPVLPIPDDQPLLSNLADPTKRARFNAAGISTGQLRVITIPDADFTLAGSNIVQTFLGGQSISGDLNLYELNLNRPGSTGTAFATNNGLASIAYNGFFTGVNFTGAASGTAIALQNLLSSFTVDGNGLVNAANLTVSSLSGSGNRCPRVSNAGAFSLAGGDCLHTGGGQTIGGALDVQGLLGAYELNLNRPGSTGTAFSTNNGLASIAYNGFFTGVNFTGAASGTAIALQNLLSSFTVDGNGLVNAANLTVTSLSGSGNRCPRVSNAGAFSLAGGDCLHTGGGQTIGGALDVQGVLGAYELNLNRPGSTGTAFSTNNGLASIAYNGFFTGVNFTGAASGTAIAIQNLLSSFTVNGNGAIVGSGLTVSGMAGSGTRCAQVNNSGVFAVASAGCGLGTVTSIATSGPIGGGTITGTGTITCTTCVTTAGGQTIGGALGVQGTLSNYELNLNRPGSTGTAFSTNNGLASIAYNGFIGGVNLTGSASTTSIAIQNLLGSFTVNGNGALVASAATINGAVTVNGGNVDIDTGQTYSVGGSFFGQDIINGGAGVVLDKNGGGTCTLFFKAGILYAQSGC